jgi:hypothetical protein
MTLGPFPYVKLREIVSFRNGYQARNSKSMPIDEDTQGEGRTESSAPIARVIQVRHTDRDFMQINLADVEIVPFVRSKKTETYEVKEDEFVFLAKGKPAAFGVVGWDQCQDQLPVIASSHFFIGRPIHDEVNVEYLVWVLNQRPIEVQIDKHISSSAAAFISKTDLLDLEIPLASSDVQQTIGRASRLHQRAKELSRRRELLQDQLVNHVLCSRLYNHHGG